jgi:hypothetical protein
VVQTQTERLPVNWRSAQADHQDRLARFSIAMAAAYEGDVGFAANTGERRYLTKRAAAYRNSAERQLAKAQHLREVL